MFFEDFGEIGREGTIRRIDGFVRYGYNSSNLTRNERSEGRESEVNKRLRDIEIEVVIDRGTVWERRVWGKGGV